MAGDSAPLGPPVEAEAAGLAAEPPRPPLPHYERAGLGVAVYGQPMPDARLRWPQMAHPKPARREGELSMARVLHRGEVVSVPAAGTQRSYVEVPGWEALVDNAELEWLPEPARPSRWEVLGGPDWLSEAKVG